MTPIQSGVMFIVRGVIAATDWDEECMIVTGEAVIEYSDATAVKN